MNILNQDVGLAHLNGQLSDQLQNDAGNAQGHQTDPRCHLQTRYVDQFLASRPAAEDPLDIELLN